MRNTFGSNCNEESLPGVELAVVDTFRDEMEAFDALGPLAKAAMEAFPAKMLAWHIVQQCRANGWEPKSRRVDEHVARCIREDMARIPKVVPDDFSFDKVRNAIERAARRAA